MAGQSELPAVLRRIAKGNRVALLNTVLAELIENMEPGGRVAFTRQQIAQRLGTHHTRISAALCQLEEMGAIFRRHDRTQDVHATIFVSANLASGLAEMPRKRRQRQDPLVHAAA